MRGAGRLAVRSLICSRDRHGADPPLLAMTAAKILRPPFLRCRTCLCTGFDPRVRLGESIMRALVVSFVALLGTGSLGFAQDQSLRGVYGPPGAAPPPAKSGKSAPSGLEVSAPSAMVRASRSSARRLKVRRFRATSPRPRSPIGPAMGPRSSTAIARLSTSATTASSRSWTRGFRLREDDTVEDRLCEKERPPTPMAA